jgi:hypothetical protein
MRLIAIGLLVSLATPVHAADKDEDKAKEVTAAFIKAVVAKDIDAIMKTVDTPFVTEFGRDRLITKTEELKKELAKLLEGADPEKIKTVEIGTVYDMAGIAKYAKNHVKELMAEPEKFIELAEKIAGKSGYLVMIKTKKEQEMPGVLVRIKDGKAFVVGVQK